MATRMQQRRGTAAQWTSANPTLAAGEIGFETDTNKFKVGNGSSAWSSLAYFVDASIVFDSSEVQGLIDTAVSNLVDAAPNTLNTLNELAQAINDDSNFAVTVSNNLTTLNTAVNGIGIDLQNTMSNLNAEIANNITNYLTLSNNITGVSNSVTAGANNLSAHESATANVHGITNTANLVYTNNSALTDERVPTGGSVTEAKIATGAVTNEKIGSDAVNGSKIADDSIAAEHIADEAINNSHISNTAAIAQSKISGLTTDLGNKQDKVAGVSDTEIGYLDGVTSNVQAQIDGKASLSGATFTGSVEIDHNLTVDGNFIVNGSNVLVSATQIQIEDTLLQLGHDNANNITDLGLVVGYNDGVSKHAGIVKDVTDGKWKLFKDLTVEPSTVVDFTSAALDTLSVGVLESANAITATGGVAFSDGTQTKEGVPSQTTIISKSASYTLSSLTERDDLIEVDSASATTITIPTNSVVAFPVGTSIDVLQIGAGQVTIAGDSGVTVNGTPGLKLRTQWSSATLFKRAENTWVVLGDLTA
jgi:hypothetical protein